ncbi:OmpA family protein [Pseudozobellia thermophila]|uniref:OmpA family protein n=1 Tax=Pseudozobellia thermophila TaxID=192903 RepID=A0A1M6HFD4_9FLAO|nr:OmpA family protein [Pseudozobellia thermophila]SHJ20915.1 OmpA family protein [Pseudozobellia thermophila]
MKPFKFYLGLRALCVQVLVLCSCNTVIVGQNLVPNPSFEDYVNCPERLGNFDKDVKEWSAPSSGSTDYFNACSSKMGTPENFNGAQRAKSGTGYAGLYLYAPDDYREYLQVELGEPLEQGKKYQVSFYVSLAERSDFAIKEFGVLFSNAALQLSTKKELSKKLLYQQRENDYNYMEIGYSNFYSDTKDWVPVHTEFVAKGTERFMLMGNFKNNRRTRLFKTRKNAKQGAYYYVDMFEVKAVGTIPNGRVAGNTPSVKKIELGKTHIFEDVLFTFDGVELTLKAERELREIYSYLATDERLSIAVKGHTDTIGSERYNHSLSQKRAKVVADYLIGLGLPETRIAYQGYGGKNPRASNKTSKGRQRNRRVEFVITQDKPMDTPADQ